MPPCDLSVIIPCHNDGRYLNKAVESVLGQECPVKGMEVLIVDDHNSDPQTLDVLSDLEKADPRIHVLHNTGRTGPSAARNFGVSSAGGEWLAFLDADDVWLPGGLNARWQVVENEPQARWISADFEIMSLEDGSLVSNGYHRNNIPTSLILSPAFDSGKTLKLRKPVRETITSWLAWSGAVIIKKPLFLAVGGFDEDLWIAEDIHLWVRLALETDFFFVPQPVAQWRWHKGSLTWYSQRAQDKMLKGDHFDLNFAWDWHIAAFKKLLRNPRLRPYRSLLYNRLVVFSTLNFHHCRHCGKPWHALREAARVLRCASIEPGRWKTLLHGVFHK